MVDGKQRLLALKAFVEGEVDAVLWSGERIRYADLGEDGQRGFQAIPVPVIELSESTTEQEVMTIYIRLNRGRTPHSVGEIERVRAMLSSGSESPSNPVFERNL